MPDATYNWLTPEDFKGTMLSLDEEGSPKDIETFEYNKMMFVICGYNFIPMCVCNAGNPHCPGDPDCTAGGGQITGFSITPNYCFLNVAGGDGSDGGGVYTNPATNNGYPSGSGSGGSISTTAVYFSPAEIRIKKFNQQLTLVQKNCLNSLPNGIKETLIGFLNPNAQLVEGCEIIIPTEEEVFDSVEEQLSGLCGSNSTETIAQFQNWFSAEIPGSEDIVIYNPLYWNNQLLNFPQQSLPTYDAFYSAYPLNSTTAKQLSTQIGGEILTLYNNIISSGKK